MAEQVDRGTPSRSFELKGQEGAAEGVRRIALGRAERARERLADARDAELAGAIHGARKDLKKLRALLRLVRGELGAKTFRVENRRYRDAGRLLSGSRDAEVKLATLAALRDRFADLPEPAAKLWSGALETERDGLANAVREASRGQIEGAREAIAAGRDGIRAWSLREDSWALVGPGLSRSYRSGRRAMKRARAEPTAGNVHDWRKHAKDLWYQLRIVRAAWPQSLGATAAQAHELTDLLGDHHDLAMLAGDLPARELDDGTTFEGAIAKRQTELLDASFAIGRRLYAEKPKAFRRRVERYWLAWRGA